MILGIIFFFARHFASDATEKPAICELPMTQEHTTMHRNFDYFCIEDGLVFREVTINYEKRKKKPIFAIETHEGGFSRTS